MMPLHLEGPCSTLAAAVVALAGAVGCPARAQELVPVAEEPIPGLFDASWSSPVIVEAGSLVVFARELGPSTPRAIRVHARAGVAVEPPIDAADAASCGSGRWIVTARTTPSRDTNYELMSPNGSVAWSRSFPQMSLPWVGVECAGATALFGWIDDGELVIAEATGNALGVEQRVRIAPSGSRTITTWVASSSVEIFVAVHVIVPTGSTELLRISSGAITHRRSLGRSTDVRLALARERLVAAFHDDRGQAIVTSYARSDLVPGSVTAIAASEHGRNPSITSLWPGPNGVVVLAIQESWEGPDFATISQGPGQPDRFEPAYHTAAYLQPWTHASGQLGRRTDSGAEWAGSGAWLGSTLVVVEPVRRDRNSPDQLRFYPARVRRFQLRNR